MLPWALALIPGASVNRDMLPPPDNFQPPDWAVEVQFTCSSFGPSSSTTSTTTLAAECSSTDPVIDYCNEAVPPLLSPARGEGAGARAVPMVVPPSDGAKYAQCPLEGPPRMPPTIGGSDAASGQLEEVPAFNGCRG